jgi:hypothetical protein
MPVARGPQVNARSALLVGLTGVLIAALLVVAVLWLADSSSQVEVNLGDSDFRDLDAGRISSEIADRGPILFSDVAGGDRDIILQHLGDDPDTGWLAFDARRAGDARDCFFEWQPASATFVNTCDADDVVDEEGSGLDHYPVTVTDGEVRIDINADR